MNSFAKLSEFQALNQYLNIKIIQMELKRESIDYISFKSTSNTTYETNFTLILVGRFKEKQQRE